MSGAWFVLARLARDRSALLGLVLIAALGAAALLGALVPPPEALTAEEEDELRQKQVAPEPRLEVDAQGDWDGDDGGDFDGGDGDFG